MLRCMAEGRNGNWYAVCIDLDIAVEGHSFAEVRGSLEQAINLYLARVSELPGVEQDALLNRRSPWRIRAKFALVWLFGKLLRGDGHQRYFTLPTHVPV